MPGFLLHCCRGASVEEDPYHWRERLFLSLLRRFRKGAAESDRIHYEHFGLLDAQGLRDFDE